MELLVTLSNKEDLLELSELDIDGVIFGSLFSSRYNYSYEDFLDTVNKVKSLNLKVYVSVDTFISEDDIEELYIYFEELNKLNVDGIYYNDLAVLEVAKTYGMADILIYDGGPMLTNSLDIESYLGLGIDSVVLARELTMSETIDIISQHLHKLDMQVFGHLRMSTSKRKFLSNYFEFINSDYNPLNKDSITIVEEKRDYRLPIKETKYGTNIYSDFILESIEEMPYLRKMLKRAIVDDAFLSLDVVKDAVTALQRVEEDNSYFIQKAFISEHQDLEFSSGYYYTKTNIAKEDEQN